MSKGSLIIAGGAIKAASALIFGELVRRAGGVDRRFALIPAATANPEAAWQLYVRELVSLGVSPENIELIELSPIVPAWRDGARQTSELAKVERADAIWIAGGNQNNIIEALLEDDGSDSPMAALLRQRLDGGAVLGGTSAGAAVMSDIMIGGGTSYGALGLPRAQDEGKSEMSDALFVSQGLGLFPWGIVDQHFDARARLGRLLEAAIMEGNCRRPAFGIAEDTALVWDAATNLLTAIGTGGVCIAELASAQRDKLNGQSRISGVVLHYISKGDSWNPASGEFHFAGKQRLTVADTQFALPVPEVSGVFSPYGRLVDFIANLLLDNDPAGLCVDDASGLRFARSYLYAPVSLDCPSDSGRTGLRPAWELRFGYQPGSAELWFGDSYGFSGVQVQILPASVEIKILE
jgi:cyanophycinase